MVPLYPLKQKISRSIYLSEDSAVCYNYFYTRKSMKRNRDMLISRRGTIDCSCVHAHMCMFSWTCVYELDCLGEMDKSFTSPTSHWLLILNTLNITLLSIDTEVSQLLVLKVSPLFDGISSVNKINIFKELIPLSKLSKVYVCFSLGLASFYHSSETCHFSMLFWTHSTMKGQKIKAVSNIIMCLKYFISER